MALSAARVINRPYPGRDLKPAGPQSRPRPVHFINTTLRTKRFTEEVSTCNPLSPAMLSISS